MDTQLMLFMLDSKVSRIQCPNNTRTCLYSIKVDEYIAQNVVNLKVIWASQPLKDTWIFRINDHLTSFTINHVSKFKIVIL